MRRKDEAKLGGEVFYAHRAVLSARSTVLREVLSDRTINRLQFSEMTAGPFLQLLHVGRFPALSHFWLGHAYAFGRVCCRILQYLYGGEVYVQLSPRVVAELLLAAAKYNLPGVKPCNLTAWATIKCALIARRAAPYHREVLCIIPPS